MLYEITNQLLFFLGFFSVRQNHYVLPVTLDIVDEIARVILQNKGIKVLKDEHTSITRFASRVGVTRRR